MRFRLTLTAAIVAALFSTRANALRVVTTLPDLAAIAEEIGGDLVDVDAIARGVQDPHYVEAKPSFIRKVNRADLLIFNGLELEVGWLPLLIQGARNPKLTPGSSGLLDASTAVEKLEVPEGEVDRSMGDVHPQGNPHYLLDPRNGVLVAAAIAERLSDIDPKNRADYEANLSRFEDDLRATIEAWETKLESIRGRKIVGYHRTWAYLAEWAGLEVINHVEEKPGIPPGPRHLSALVDQMNAQGVRAIIATNYNPTKSADSVSQRVGGEVIVLPVAVGAEKPIKTYTDLFDEIVARLAQIVRSES